MGWIGRIVRRQMGMDGLERDAAQVAARVNILARADEDRRRTQRHDDGTPLARWRWVAGRWERWSFIEDGFVPDDPPQTLLDHVASAGGPQDGQELRLVDGTWRTGEEEPVGTPAEAPTSSSIDAPPPTGAVESEGRTTEGDGGGHPAPLAEAEADSGADTGGGGEAQPADVAAQIEAWRRRSG